jgi:NADH dehydrogenase
MQGGLHAANRIRRRLHGETEEVPFKYRDLGSAAAIGRFQAIVSVKGLRLSGFPGFVVWLFVHITFLNGFGNRFTTLYRWAKAMIGRARPESVFSVGHTGGDLSLPDKVRAQVMPSPFPVMDAVVREKHHTSDTREVGAPQEHPEAVPEGPRTTESGKR